MYFPEDERRYARFWDRTDVLKPPADKGGVRQPNAFSSDLPFVPRTAAGSRLLVRLRSRIPKEAAHPGRTVPETLAACGCNGFLRHEAASGIRFSFQLPLESAFSVYWRLVEGGLVFDVQSHRALTHLCLLQRQSLGHEAVEQAYPVELEVLFQSEIRRAPRLFRISHA